MHESSFGPIASETSNSWEEMVSEKYFEKNRCTPELAEPCATRFAGYLFFKHLVDWNTPKKHQNYQSFFLQHARQLFSSTI